MIGPFYLAELELPVEVWSVGRALEGVPTEALVERLLAPPLASRPAVAVARGGTLLLQRRRARTSMR